MQTFVTTGGYGRDRLRAKVSDSGIPNKPTVTYVGQPSFPKNGLTFETTAFSDPQGAGAFAAMQWRVAEVHNPSVANYDPTKPYIYEIEGNWESDIVTSFGSQITIPSEAVEVGKTYRTRVRMQDSSGEWSHWSEPVEFLTTTAPPTEVAQFLRVSELNYNPADNGDAEFIEFTNISSGGFATTLDLSGVIITDGPSDPYVLPQGTTLAPGEHIVVVRDLPEFTATYPAVAGSQIVGEYQGGLSNGGERVKVEDSGGNVIFDLDYTDSDPWPEWADGLGGSLVMSDPTSTPFEEVTKPRHWRGSTEPGGSPAAINAEPLGVVINEVLAHTDPPLTLSDSIELMNTTANSVDISGWYLSDAGGNLFKYEIPTGTVLAAGGLIVFDENDFNPTPLTPGPDDFALSGAHGDDVWLVMPNGSGGVTAFADEVHFRASANGETMGRIPIGSGRLVPLDRNSLGCHSVLPRVGPLVISELNYNPGPPSAAALAQDATIDGNDLEFIEIL